MRIPFEFHGSDIAVGTVDPLPGCSQMAVFHSSFVLPQHRGSGFGDLAHKERLDYAKKVLYDAALCTVANENSAQRKILSDNGWKELFIFKSRKTGNHVVLYAKEL